jgi:hypothetical protein
MCIFDFYLMIHNLEVVLGGVREKGRVLPDRFLLQWGHVANL